MYSSVHNVLNLIHANTFPPGSQTHTGIMVYELLYVDIVPILCPTSATFFYFADDIFLKFFIESRIEN